MDSIKCQECGKTSSLKNTRCSYCGNSLVWQKALLSIQKNAKLLIIIFIIIVAIISLSLFIIHKSLTSNILGTWYNSKSPYTYISSISDLNGTLGSLYNEGYISDSTYTVEDYIIFKPNGICEFYKTLTNIETKETDTQKITCRYKLNFSGTKVKLIGHDMSMGNEDIYFPISNNTIKFDFNYDDSIMTFGEYVKK